MSRSSHQRQQQKLQQQQQLLAHQQQMADNDAAAAAAELFDLFCVATTMRQVLGLHRNMCDLVGLRPAPLNEFYPKLKAKIRSWKAQALWKKFDARAAHRAYSKGTAATGTRVLVIGAGPCGLRTAIEAQLLGAKVVVVEKRDRISRNNVLHLWPFVITDLRNLGAKKFYGKFCAGSIDHISIRQIQCILLKVALLLGVEVHEGVSFDGTIEPNGDGCGWRAAVSPEDHAVSHYEFDVLIGADGKRNTLEGFKRKEFRGKLAIAITANFINKKTEAEAKAEEISGVAFIFNQSFFKELYHTTGIDLENIVYYKDETHYFVMTAKKHSLIDKGVIMQDFADPAELLAPANVNTEKLLDYAREAAEFSTKYQMPNLEFAVNHYGKPDVAMFDFTSMFAAETSCRAIVRKGFRLLQCLVGDSLLEPFWPTGSGCARGFLSSMDAAYAIKLWSNAHNSTLGVLAQRESIYRLLNQTTPENLQRDIGSYTVDPATRYPNLNRTSVNVWQVKHLIDTDDTAILEQTFMDTNALQATQVDTPVRRKRRSGDSLPLSTVLLRWICAQLHSYEFTRSLKEVSDVFTHGKVLCALINRYRPDLVDFNAIKELSSVECNDIAFRVLEKELNIPRIMTGKDAQKLNTVESKIWLNYLEQICEVFRGEIPHVKHPKMDFSELRDKHRYNANVQPDFSKLLQISTKHKAKPSVQDMVDTTPQAGVQRRSVLDEEKLKRQRKHAAEATAAAAAADQQGHTDTPRRAKKRRSAEKAANIEERQKRLQEIEENRQDRQSKRRQQRYQQTQNFYKSLHMLQANTLLRESDEASAFEDYSIFMYRQNAPVFNDRVKELERKLLFPDRERSDIPSALPRNATDEQFSDRIKSMEQRITSRNTYGTEKKPKDLMRAIGKIDSNDWNVREIEKKIEQSKKTEIHGPKGREKVPKWSKEQFMARQNKMSKPMRQDSGEEKFKEIDQTLKNLDKQLKEGSVLEIGERGRNKVASIAGQFVKKDDTSDEKNPPTVVQKSSSKVALAFKKQAASEKCHFCKQTVYLMEKTTTEGLILHRSCLKCYHCHTNLRPGGYAFDRDDPNGHFYCTQHFRLPAKAIRPVVRKPGQRKPTQQQQHAATAAAATTVAKNDGDNVAGVDGEPKTPDKLRGHADSVAQLDLLDRGQTPERIEFENTDAMSDGEPSEEHIIDENEWSGRNFLPESNNDSESDLSSSEESDTESDSDIFEEANDSPLGVQTLQLATDWIGKQNYSDSDDSDDFYDSSDGVPDDGKDDTEGEEFKKARELRREEVRLLPLPANLPTDTETELKLSANENKENIETKIEKSEQPETITQNMLPLDLDKHSEKSFNSEKSFLSTNLSLNGETNSARRASNTTKADMEKIEQNSDHKFTTEIDEISEKLYRLNNIVKLNKDLENLAKENLVQSDIKKKLTLKEKWLANNNVGTTNSDAAKSQFDEKLEKLLRNSETGMVKAEQVQMAETILLTDALKESKIPQPSPLTERKNTQLSRNNSLKEPSAISPNTSPYVGRKTSAAASRSDSFKSTTSPSPKLSPKSVNVSRSNSLKKPAAAISAENKMQLENILDIVKNIDISGSDVKDEPESPGSDIGKMLYDVETKFSPKSKRGMTAKLKEIEAKSFAGTMDSIKSQMVMPTVSSQAAPSVDLSKYFPNQKQEKASSGAVNKNQKNLKDVDLTKYFPSSPVPQRRTTLTVAEKLKKSQTEATMLPVTQTSQPAKVSTVTSKEAPKRQASLGSAALSLREHQLDGAVDLAKRKAPVVKTSTATATATKKGNIKIIKKIVPKGTKAKKAAEAESERILDEILHIDDQEDVRSPSLEYKKLFDEEKSPSEDISDKIERILEETGIDLGLPKKPATDKTKILLKAKSLGEGEFERKQCKLSDKSSNSSLSAKEDGDQPAKGVQNILRRFESLSSFKSQEQPFKLQRMESSTSNLNKSRESLVSRESDSLSDLDKTMEYLKTEWRNEATNFLQKKRDKFYAHKRSVDDEVAAKTEQQKKSRLNELPVQYRESKLAKFFGIKQKSPEKRKSPVKKKSPEKTKTTEKKKSPEKKLTATTKEVQKSTPPTVTPAENYTKKSLENQADLSVKKTAEILKKSGERTLTSESPTRKPSKGTDEKLTKTKERADTASSDVLEDGEEKIPKASEIIAKLESKIRVKQTLRKNEIEAEPTISVPKEPKQLDVTDSSKPLSNDLKTDENNDLAKSNFARRPAIETLETKMEVVDTATANPPLDAQQLTDQLAAITQSENRRPLVEDIKNLPKFGCDKSLNNSRRGSQTSLQSRRQSDASLTDQLEKAATELSKTSSTQVETTAESIFQEIVQQLDDSSETSPKDLAASTNINNITKGIAADFSKDESHSLSLSTSLPQTTVQLRGSSEDESIEKLFGQFSDDMLVDVEFDSNDELVAITPRAVSRNIVETEAEADRDYLGKLESLEKDPEVIEENISKLVIMNEATHTQNRESPKLYNDLLEDSSSAFVQFPVRPQRRQKSSSSSTEPSAPIVPQRLKKKLAKLDPTDMPPSVQDVLQEIFSNHIEPENAHVETTLPLQFPHKIYEDENFGTIIPPADDALGEKKKDMQNIEERRFQRRLSADLSQITLVLPSRNEKINSDVKKQTKDRSSTIDNISVVCLENKNNKIDVVSVSTLDEGDSTIPEYNFRKNIGRKMEDTDSLHEISCTLATTPKFQSLDKPHECDEKNTPSRRLSSAKIQLSSGQSFEHSEKKESNIKTVENAMSKKKHSPATESKTASLKTQEKDILLDSVDSESDTINRKSSLTSLKCVESNSSTTNTQQTPSEGEITTTPLYRRLSAASIKYKNSQKENEKTSISTTSQTEHLPDQKEDKITIQLHTPKIIVTENRRPSQDSLTSNNSHSSKRNSSAQTTTTIAYSNTHSKENTLDWDMEQIPASPMPRRKFVHAERGAYQEPINREQTSRTSSTKSLNITQQLQESTVPEITEEERSLMEEFERERRESLTKRDKEYAENHKILDIPVRNRRNSTLDAESDYSSAQTMKHTSQRSVSPSDKFEQERRQDLAKRDKEYEEHQKTLLERRQSSTENKETVSIKSPDPQTSSSPPSPLKSAMLDKPVTLATLTPTQATPEISQRSVSPSEKLEQERRQALSKRDREYEKHLKTLVERRQSITENTEADSIKSLDIQTSTTSPASIQLGALEKPVPTATSTPTQATAQTLQGSASPSDNFEQEQLQALRKRDKEFAEQHKPLTVSVPKRQSTTENKDIASTTTCTPPLTKTLVTLEKLTPPSQTSQRNSSPSEKFEQERRQALAKRDREYAEQHKTLAVTVPKSQSTTENQENESIQHPTLLAAEAHKPKDNPSILEKAKVPPTTSTLILEALNASQSRDSPTALAKRDKEFEEHHKTLAVTVPKEYKESGTHKRTPLVTDAPPSLEKPDSLDIKPTITLETLNTLQSRESPTEKLEQERRQALRQRDKEYAEHHKTLIFTKPKQHSSTYDKESDTIKKDPIQTATGIPVYIPDSDDNDEPIPEAFKNRSWPKRDVDVRSKSVESADNMEHFVLRLRKDRTTPNSESPIDDMVKNRAWTQSYQRQKHRDNADIFAYRKNTSPHNSTNSLKPGQQPRSSQSSVDTEANSFMSSRSVEHISALPQRHKVLVSAVDTGTRLLLDRGKDLHDRKRDFMNERVAERNSYAKTRQMNNAAYDDDDDNDVLESYRPKNHTSSTSRKFPTTRTPVRSSHSRHFDYLSTTPTSLYPGLRSSGSSKRVYTSTIPTAAASSSHNYLHYPSHSTAYTSSAIPTRTHFADYFRRSPSNHRDRSGELSKESCVQTDSESSSSNKVEQNSATEISTDSEFDHDEIIRETPKIFIDDTHLRKPTKVQVKSSIISPSLGQKYHTATTVAAAQTKGGSYLQKYQTNHQPLQPQFKPLVQVDPSVLCANRIPLHNPRPGDYLLNKTASTEGIASKKSLELKKRYLLGEQANGSKIQKSGSTSVLDSKIRSFHSNISECQKLLNPSNDISPTMKNFLDRTKLSEQHSTSDASNILRHSATGNILNDLKVEITIQKASSTASTDNEKENLFVNSKNELNKGMEYSETVNSTLVESLSKKSPTTPTNNQTIIETIDLVTPEKKTPIIDLTQVEIPTKMLESNVEFINNIDVCVSKDTIAHTCSQLLHTDSNKMLDATCESPARSDTTVIEDVKPDVSKDVKECIPDIIEHIETCDVAKTDNKTANICNAHGGDEEQLLLSNSYDEEKKDSPEKNVAHDYEHDDLQIQVPNIPWSTRKLESCSSSASSNCTSNTSSIEDIQHYILESTTSPDTQTAPNGHQVPRLEVHDTTGELMQIDSLMIIDGRYIGDPEDLKLMNIPEGLIIPDMAPIKTSEIDDEPDIDPVTATPEPADHTVIEAEYKEPPPLPDNGPPLPERGPPKMKPVDLKFDTKNENKVESLKNLPLIVEQTSETCHAMKPLTLNLKPMQQSPNTSITPKANNAVTPLSPLVDNDKTPTAELYSRGSDSETEATGTGQVLTETELSDWTADDCISENFIDLEFVLNSSKGTIKRNKNGAKKKKTLSSYKQLPMTDRRECSKVNDAHIAPVAEFEGILRNLDIDEIEFMDTGSEGSCAEAYSATNTAMLRNRGYMEYIETAPKTTSRKINEDNRSHQSSTGTAINVAKYKPVPTKRDEVLGIDYIEQGAYIMQRGDSHNDLLKTPVNELPSQTVTPTAVEKALRTQLPNALTQSLTDSSTLNDVDDDSLGLGTTNSATNTKTTTDESEALTVVTSPLDSSSPKMAEAFTVKGSLSTPSSSDKNPKTSTLSACTPATSSNATSSRQDILVPTSMGSNSVPPTAAPNSAQRQSGDDLSYEEYVRALQQKITQISNARDSLDTRKQRRKSSKGEAPQTNFSTDAQTVIEKTRTAGGGGHSEKEVETPTSLALAATQPVDAAIVAQQVIAASAQVHKVPEIPTLTRRLEEITKERTKQKDLIHDLVMDKLQSKKQLNAEKRLHRSRQRTMLTSGGCGYTSGSSLSPTPKLAAAATITDTNCTNKAHYHVSTSAVRPPTERQAVKERSSSSSLKENNPLQKSATYVAAYRTDVAVSPTKAALAYKQRPFSENLDADQVDPLERYKLTKTPSFSYPMSTSKRNLNSQQPIKEQQLTNSIYKSPIAPMRNNRGRSSSSATVERSIVVGDDDELSVVVSSASTEKLRTEARARARLKSNNELGLSPEEKMQLLRKRLHLEDVIAGTVTPNCTAMQIKSVNKVLSPREHKMSSSKSVNDLVTAGAHYGSKLNYCAADENSNTTQTAVISDFTSDPNLLLSSTSQAAAVKTLKSSKSNRRSKDPERRKSIIQSLSNFFHMGSSSGGGGGGSNAINKKDSSNAGATASAANSAQPERPGTSSSSTTSSSVDGVFSRFRITAKSKEKSKDKDGGHIDASIRSHATKTTQYERSNSQDCILNTRTNNISNTKHNNLNHHPKHLRSSSTTSVTAKYSASSPQLYVAKNNAALHVDEQIPPPIPPLPLNYQRSDDESYATETREQKKQRSISKAVRQAELKRLRIAQEIQREQEEIEVQLKELEARGVLIEKALRGEGQHVDSLESSNMMGASDEKLLKELLEIWRNITQLKKRDDELGIRQQELQLEHRHAQLKEELNVRLSSSKLDKSSADVAAEGAILNEMLEIVAKRASLRPTATTSSAADKETKSSQAAAPNANIELVPKSVTTRTDTIKLNAIGGQSFENNESQI